MWLNPQETADLVTFTEEILCGKFISCLLLPTIEKICKYTFYGFENARKCHSIFFWKISIKEIAFVLEPSWGNAKGS